jgi:hypothetical protein
VDRVVNAMTFDVIPKAKLGVGYGVRAPTDRAARALRELAAACSAGGARG